MERKESKCVGILPNQGDVASFLNLSEFTFNNLDFILLLLYPNRDEILLVR